jgi:hypothetical protein
MAGQSKTLGRPWPPPALRLWWMRNMSQSGLTCFHPNVYAVWAVIPSRYVGMQCDGHSQGAPEFQDLKYQVNILIPQFIG